MNDSSDHEEEFKDPEISKFIHDFYQPEDGDELDIWSSVERQISNEQKTSEILSDHQIIEKDYLDRQEKISELEEKVKTKFEDKFGLVDLMDLDKAEYHPEILVDESEGILDIKERYWVGLSAYMDGELSPQRQRIITEHLMECSLCRERFNKLNQLSKVIKEKYEAPAMPEAINVGDFELEDEYNLEEELTDMDLDSSEFRSSKVKVIERSTQDFWDEFEKRIRDKKIKVARSSYKTKKIVAALLVVSVLGLGGIASLNHTEEYTYVPPNSDKVNWYKLNLNDDQKQRLDLIDSDWLVLKSQSEDFINDRKEKLSLELSKTNPNLSLIDQYHREILDKEVLLKREEVNVALQKRFILNEKQTMSLLEQLRTQ